MPTKLIYVDEYPILIKKEPSQLTSLTSVETCGLLDSFKTIFMCHLVLNKHSTIQFLYLFLHCVKNSYFLLREVKIL